MELFYREYGDGHPLIILHGLYGSSDNWVTIGRALSKYFKVYLLDQRNHGRSPHAAPLDYAHMQNDLAGFIEGHGLEKVSLIGHSMGGKTAMAYALHNPGRIANLVVADISPRDYSTQAGHSPQYEVHKNLIETMRGVEFRSISTREQIDQALAKGIEAPRVRQFLMKNIERDENNEFHWRINLEAIAQHLPDVLKSISLPNSQEGAFPALFIRGENSGYVPETDFSLIRELFPYAKIITLPNTGHWLHAEKPEAFIKSVRDFIF